MSKWVPDELVHPVFEIYVSRDDKNPKRYVAKIFRNGHDTYSHYYGRWRWSARRNAESGWRSQQRRNEKRRRDEELRKQTRVNPKTSVHRIKP